MTHNSLFAPPCSPEAYLYPFILSSAFIDILWCQQGPSKHLTHCSKEGIAGVVPQIVLSFSEKHSFYGHLPSGLTLTMLHLTTTPHPIMVWSSKGTLILLKLKYLARRGGARL